MAELAPAPVRCLARIARYRNVVWAAVATVVATAMPPPAAACEAGESALSGLAEEVAADCPLAMQALDPALGLGVLARQRSGADRGLIDALDGADRIGALQLGPVTTSVDFFGTGPRHALARANLRLSEIAEERRQALLSRLAAEDSMRQAIADIRRMIEADRAARPAPPPRKGVRPAALVDGAPPRRLALTDERIRHYILECRGDAGGLLAEIGTTPAFSCRGDGALDAATRTRLEAARAAHAKARAQRREANRRLAALGAEVSALRESRQTMLTSGVLPAAYSAPIVRVLSGAGRTEALIEGGALASAPTFDSVFGAPAPGPVKLGWGPSRLNLPNSAINLAFGGAYTDIGNGWHLDGYTVSHVVQGSYRFGRDVVLGAIGRVRHGELKSHPLAAKIEQQEFGTGVFANLAPLPGVSVTAVGMYALADNAEAASGTEGDFISEKLGAVVRIAGRWSDGPWAIEPTASLSYNRLARDDYLASDGVAVPGGVLERTQVDFGPKLSYCFGRQWPLSRCTVKPHLQFRGSYRMSAVDEFAGERLVTRNLDHFGAGVGAGLELGLADKLEIRLGVGYDGLFGDDLEVIRGRFELRLPFG